MIPRDTDHFIGLHFPDRRRVNDLQFREGEEAEEGSDGLLDCAHRLVRAQRAGERNVDGAERACGRQRAHCLSMGAAAVAARPAVPHNSPLSRPMELDTRHHRRPR